MATATIYRCDFKGCGKEFASAASLKGHKTSHSEKYQAIGVFPCEEPGCDKVFDRPKKLQAHRSSAHSAIATTKGVFRCPDCPMVFETQQALNSHVHAKHVIVSCDQPGCTWSGTGVSKRWHKFNVHGLGNSGGAHGKPKSEVRPRGKAKEVSVSEPEVQVSERIRSLAEPLQNELAMLQERRAVIEAERTALDEDLRRLTAMLKIAAPETFPARPYATNGSKKTRKDYGKYISAEKMEAVRAVVAAYEDGGEVITGPVKEATGLHPTAVVQALKNLHNEGMLRLVGMGG